MRKGQMKQTNTKAQRAVFAAVVAATMLVTFGALGGVGLAKTAISVAQYQYGGQEKVTLCHKGKNTITVGAPAVAAHKRHGDTVGTCAAAKAKAEAKAKAKAETDAKAAAKAQAKAKAAAKAEAKAKAASEKSKGKAKGKAKKQESSASSSSTTSSGDKGNKGNGKGDGKG